MLAICAMSLPGISGSFILLLLGLYEYIISIIKDLSHFKFNFSDFTRLVVLSFGVVAGFVLFVRILKWLLSKYEGELMAFLAGLMLASLRILWPFIDNSQEVSRVWMLIPR
ncbi:MAG: hypothetical protein KatS3mg085_435 [Candidatus Dojkabacteria bacterium]|nr:MAG: hypothetical protein KatS3mg085_435 [Candidatus Dojkabacteria bacterium]